MHTELLVDTVRRSREEESLLRRRADELRKLEEAICDPKLSAIFTEEVAARERRANEFRALAEQCEQFLADKPLAE